MDNVGIHGLIQMAHILTQVFNLALRYKGYPWLTALDCVFITLQHSAGDGGGRAALNGPVL